MKFFVAFMFVGLCAVQANPTGMVNTGHSAQFRSQDSLGNYAFGYNEDHATGGTFRRETGSPGMAHGSYGLRTIDGRVRVVNYVADGHGFRANIQTNEPGVEDQDPASVLINKAAAIVAPYLNKAAPAGIALQHSVEAPVVAAAPALLESHGSYGAGPLLESAPVVAGQLLADHQPIAAAANQYMGQYEPAGQYVAAEPQLLAKSIDSAPVLSSYTTKTYASPAPILSQGDSAAAALLYGGVGKQVAGYGPASLELAEPSIYGGGQGLAHLKK